MIRWFKIKVDITRRVVTNEQKKTRCQLNQEGRETPTNTNFGPSRQQFQGRKGGKDEWREGLHDQPVISGRVDLIISTSVAE